jgi:hypothetical protein
MPRRTSTDDQTLEEAQGAELASVSEFDQAVYKAIAAYAFDEAISFVSQARVAEDLGCARESVNRAVRRLVEAGWLVIRERRFSWRSGWFHNVYELLAPFVTGWHTMRRITRRAHRRNRCKTKHDHTNGYSECGCGVCRVDRGGYSGGSPVEQAILRWRPRGPDWREKLAGRLRRLAWAGSPIGRDLRVSNAADMAYDLDGFLSAMPALVWQR